MTDHEFDEPGGRYIDFLVPGLLGMSLMGGGLWGVGFVTVDMRIRKLLKRFLATPMRRSDFLAGIMISRLLFMVPEVLVLLVFARLAFGVRDLRQPAGGVGADSVGRGHVRRARPAGGQPRQDAGGRLRADEPGDAADVDAVGHLLFVRAISRRSCSPLIKALPLTALIDALRAVMQEGAAAGLAVGRKSGCWRPGPW